MFVFSVVLAAENRNISVIDPRVATGIPPGCDTHKPRGGVWPTPIPVNNVSGPVIAIAGGSDAMWNSGPSADQISSELDIDRSPYRHLALVCLNAGHGVGTIPCEPIGGQALQALGGTRAADVAAQRASWAAVLGQLAQLSG
jgi:hypothetical protein